MDISATLSSNTLVKGAEEPQTPATSRYTTWDEYVRSISGGKSGEVVKHQIFQQAVAVMQGSLFQYF